MLKHRDRHPTFAIAFDLVIKEGLKAIAVDLVGVPPEQRSLGFLCWGLIVQFNIHIYLNDTITINGSIMINYEFLRMQRPIQCCG